MLRSPTRDDGPADQATLAQAAARPLSDPAAARRDRWRAFVRLGRPKFLLYSFLLFGLGTAFSTHEGNEVDLSWYLVGQAFVWCAHLMTHYCNEYFDLPADLANQSPTSWTGGSRVLVEGTLKPAVSLRAALALLVLAVGLLAVMPSASARATAAVTVALAWFYTAPPLQLNYRGLGEVTVALVLNLLTPALGCFLQAQTLPQLFLLLCLPTMILQHARMMIMGLSDHDGDLAIGKRTLPVLLGPKGTFALVVAETLVAYGSVALFTLFGSVPATVGVVFLSTAPVAAWQIRRLLGGAIVDPRLNNSVVFWASTHVALVFCSVLVGLTFDALVDPARRALVSPTSLALSCLVIATFGVILSRQIWRNRVRGGAPAAPPATIRLDGIAPPSSPDAQVSAFAES